MIRKIRQSMRSQKGFTLVELMVVVAILGILAAIAIPRFTESTTAANTAKIAADLRTIDSAITVYLIDNPSATTISSTNLESAYLAKYPSPPKGNAYEGSTTSTAITATTYAIAQNTAGQFRASLDSKYAEDFYKPTTTTTTTGSGTGSGTSN